MGIDLHIDLTSKELKIILTLIDKYLPDTTVWAFGSRVKFKSKPESDLDIVAFIAPEQKSKYNDLKTAFDESDLPFRVDLLSWDEIPDNFKRNIEKEYAVLSDKKDDTLPQGWQIYKLEEIAEAVFSGGTPSTTNDKYWNGTFNWLSSGETGLRYIRDTEKKITELGVKESSTRLAKIGDIVIASAGQGYTRGQTSYCLIDTYINQSIVAVRVNPEIVDSKYLFFHLSNKYNELRQISDSHSSRGSLTTKLLKDLKIELPDLFKQQEIATILSSLDDKIEINREMNKTLESIAQAIFKEWFVNFNFSFDFAKGKPSLEGKPYKDSGGEIVDGLPKGWKTSTIRELANVVTGKTPSSSNPEQFGNYMPFVTPSDFKNYNKIIIDAERYLSEVGVSAFSNKILPEYSILVTCIGSDMGKVAINFVECVTNQQLNSIVLSKDKFLSDYLYYYLTGKYDYLRNIATGGSTMPIINKTQFENIDIILPSIELLEIFQEFANSINKKIFNNIKQTNSMMAIRDSILPKLMSGKIPPCAQRTGKELHV